MIVGGSIERIGNVLVLTLRLVDVETGVVAALAQQDVRADVPDKARAVLGLAEQVAQNLLLQAKRRKDLPSQ